jgi:starch synthase
MVRADPPDVLHLHDWHTGAVLAGVPEPPPSVLTLHNVAYQGVTDAGWLRRIGPRARHYEWWGGTNPLSGGIALADLVVAVSPQHAHEVVTPTRGFGLDGQLRDRGGALVGILNGIDIARWDPATDALLAAPLAAGSRSLLAARRRNRAAVLEQVGWHDDGRSLAVMVTRLTDQKGADLIVPVVPVLRHVPMRLVVLGVGEAALARSLAGAMADHPDVFSFVERHDEGLARRLFGGGDLFVMPSRFEPCGLAQMQAMRYGAIPVVTPVGGLVDTVPDIDASPDGHGFVADGADAVGVAAALFRAARLLADRRRHEPLVRRIMGLDWSWREPAARYASAYERLVAAGPRKPSSEVAPRRVPQTSRK